MLESDVKDSAGPRKLVVSETKAEAPSKASSPASALLRICNGVAGY